MITPNRALLSGIPTLVGSALAATGTANVIAFSVIKNPMASGATMLQAIGTFTVLNGLIEVSSDGGTTWTTYTNFDLITSPNPIFNLGSGLLFRLNVLNITLSVAPNIFATLM